MASNEPVALENIVTEGKFVEYKMKEMQDYVKEIIAQKGALYESKSGDVKESLHHQVFDILSAYETEMTTAEEEYEKTGNNQIMFGVTATDNKYKQSIKQAIDSAIKEEYVPITEQVMKERERKWHENTARRRREFLSTREGRQAKQQHDAAMRKQSEIRKDKKISILGKMERGNNYTEQLDDLNNRISKAPPEARRRIARQEARLIQNRDIQRQRLMERYERERQAIIEMFERRTRQYPANDEQHAARLKQIDENEERAMIPINNRTEEAIIHIKEEYVLHGRLPDEIESESENEYVEPVVNNSSPQPSPIQINEVKEVKEKVEGPNYDNLYINSILHHKISVPFVKVGNNMPLYFKRYAAKNIEGKCRKEGYIRPNSIQVVSYSTGLLHADSVLFDVVFSCDVCFPCEDMVVKCKIVNITKIGIRAIISELNNPIVLFISREHNATKNFEDYEEGSMITIKVLGVRFELNDEYISVIGEII